MKPAGSPRTPRSRAITAGLLGLAFAAGCAGNSEDPYNATCGELKSGKRSVSEVAQKLLASFPEQERPTAGPELARLITVECTYPPSDFHRPALEAMDLYRRGRSLFG